MSVIATNTTDLAATVPFHRLVLVEFRKLFDTLSGMIMTAIMLAVTVAAIVARGFVEDPRLAVLVGTAGIGFGTLLPVLGILSVTSEWSHRTALTTFTLQPRRGRALLAKCLPPLVAAVVAAGFALVVAVAVTAILSGDDNPAKWEVEPLALLGWTATGVLVVAEGLALGMLLLNAPSAIVICLSAPMVWSMVARLGDAGAIAAEWLDLNTATNALSKGAMTVSDLAHLTTATLLWIVLPMLFGFIRAMRREVR